MKEIKKEGYTLAAAKLRIFSVAKDLGIKTEGAAEAAKVIIDKYSRSGSVEPLRASGLLTQLGFGRGIVFKPNMRICVLSEAKEDVLLSYKGTDGAETQLPLSPVETGQTICLN